MGGALFKLDNSKCKGLQVRSPGNPRQVEGDLLGFQIVTLPTSCPRTGPSK